MSLGHPDRKRPSGRAGTTGGPKAAGVLGALPENARGREDEKRTSVKWLRRGATWTGQRNHGGRVNRADDGGWLESPWSPVAAVGQGGAIREGHS